MKHLFLLFFIGLATLTLCSCGEDDIPTKDALTGTVWSQKIDHTSYAIYFGINHQCTYERQTEDFTPLEVKYLYYYDAPNIRLKHLGGSDASTGHIEGDILYIRIIDDDLALKRIR